MKSATVRNNSAVSVSRPWASQLRHNAVYARLAAAVAFVAQSEDCWRDVSGALIVPEGLGNFTALHDFKGRTYCSVLKVVGTGQAARLVAAKTFRYAGDNTSGPIWYLDHVLALSAASNCKEWKKVKFSTTVPYPTPAPLPTLYFPSAPVRDFWDDFKDEGVNAYIDALRRDRHYTSPVAGTVADVYDDGPYQVVAIKSQLSKFQRIVETPLNAMPLVKPGDSVREGQRVARLAPVNVNYKKLPKDYSSAANVLASLAAPRGGMRVLYDTAFAYVSLLEKSIDGVVHLPHYLCPNPEPGYAFWDLTRSHNAYVDDQGAFVFPPVPVRYGTNSATLGMIHADLTPV